MDNNSDTESVNINPRTRTAGLSRQGHVRGSIDARTRVVSTSVPNLSSKSAVTRSGPPSVSTRRKQKFQRYFRQVPRDEPVLKYYKCALALDVLLHGHFYITANYLGFYSNTLGYPTRLLIPFASIIDVSKQKSFKIFPNAIAITTDDTRHIFCDFFWTETVFKSITQVLEDGEEAIYGRDFTPPPDEKALPPADNFDTDSLSEEEDTRNVESETDLVPEPEAIGTDDKSRTAQTPVPKIISKNVESQTYQTPIPQIITKKVKIATDQTPEPKTTVTDSHRFPDEITGPVTTIMRSPALNTILITLLALLYISAFMMFTKINRIEEAYSNHQTDSSNCQCHIGDQLSQYIQLHVDSISEMRQTLKTASEKFIPLIGDTENRPNSDNI